MQADLPEDLARAVACVDRELRMRLAAYPRWVAQKKLTQKKADEELEAMRLVRRMVVKCAVLEVEHGPFLGLRGHDALGEFTSKLPPAP